jgi:formate/nitrite transporter FocA (FNT family)
MLFELEAPASAAVLETSLDNWIMAISAAATIAILIVLYVTLASSIPESADYIYTSSPF